MIEKISQHEAVQLGITPRRVVEYNGNRVGLKLQNREDVASIYYRSGGNGHVKSFLEIPPGSLLTLDLHAPHQDLWIHASVDGAVVTMVQEFEYERG